MLCPLVRLPSLLQLLAIAVAMPAWSASSSLRGFLDKDVPAEQKWELQVQQLPESANLRSYLNFMAGEPHNAGSARSKAVAEYLLKRLTDWGLDAHIEQFEALMPYPTVRQVEVVAPKYHAAKLKEPPVPQDPSSGQPGQLPTYNAYGATGDVTAEAVYVNFGLPEDYDWLARQGINVKGKIVIARYGKSWRGIKPKIAAERGAIGCLIYSDPHEDGYFESDVYTKGPMRPPDGVQRGSVMDMTIYPGDPLSPGWASEPGSKRLTMAEAKTLMKIPVLPISYADAQPILEQLGGPVVPEIWRGSLALTYHAGSGPAQVHMKTDYDWTTKPLYDVIATIPGNEEADQWIVAGNHHDAWVNGADDPISGASALLETARVLGALQKEGWHPKRTIKIAFWDGEEFGLLGSTEWVEKHQDELRQKAVAYINSDNTAKGWLGVGGSHSLEVFATEVAGSISQPGTSTSLLEYALHHPPSPTAEQTPPTPPSKTFTLGALGAGSDYQAFLDYIGVASLNSGFEGQTKSGIYHSVYDSIYWYTHFSDTTQVDGRALSEYTAASLLRLADSSVLPFEFQHLANTINGYLDEIQKEADSSSHKMEFTNLRKQLETLKQNGVKYDALLDAARLKPALDPTKTHELNELLIRSERALTRPEGLPNRPWYKHQLYAPGFYTGYGVKTLPGIREAVESKNWQLALHETGIVEGCLSDLNQIVDQAVDKLSGF
ncbi:MAG TPA: transferrin receptor-like dimerization domain-containing protein [Bryobacteraceae bacterium]|jgi:N-acetylated-alpha-linked acidic dipeptidase|nr:transferrin receptor-like dimerization domain-containing protein [Bryobacteraceae bacterium]